MTQHEFNSSVIDILEMIATKLDEDEFEENENVKPIIAAIKHLDMFKPETSSEDGY